MHLSDLHIGNFGCSIPGLDEETQSDIREFFDPPDCVPVVAVDPENQNEFLPPYMVVAISMADYMVKSMRIEAHPQPSLKILDFGGGTFMGLINVIYLFFS
jgi:hypothetical protein